MVVVVVDFRTFVVVVFDVAVDVVVFDGAVVLVVEELVEVLVGAVVEVVDEVEVEVVVDDDGDEAGDDGLKMFGRLAISSTAVTNPSARTNTMAAVPANAFQVNRRRPASSRVPAALATPVPPVTPTTPAPAKTSVGSSGTVAGSTGSVTDASSSSAGRRQPPPAPWRPRTHRPAPSRSSPRRRRRRPPSPRVSRASPSTDDVAPPAAPVPPMRRSRVEVGPLPPARARPTCLTAFCPRSIDCATSIVPKVAAIEPMATPTIVPVTPKLDAMSAAITAPAAEARICRKENFTPGKRN